jgi:MFS transporter, PAT family, beta-lactamase induction signal transducer AmpG
MTQHSRPIMGLANLPFGLYGGVMLAAIPQLLASKGVPEPDIASVTAIGLSPNFFYFFVSPTLDVRFSRKLYANVLGFMAALLLFMALMSTDNLSLLTALLFGGQFAVVLYSSALAGWLSSLARPEDEARLSAWYTIGNFGGYGATAMVGILVLRAFPFTVGAGLLSLIVMLPLLSFPFLPSAPPDRRLASESFGQFFGDVLALLRKRTVLGALPFFITPCASFALINTLSALGNDFGTSEGTAATILGLGASLPAAGSLLIPTLARYVALRPLYLMIGSVGALFTLTLIVLPHGPVTFALAVVGENLFASAALAAATAIIFDTIGKNNPLAATQFSVLNAAVQLPAAYMQAIDGIGYGRGGLTGTLLTDASISLITCGTLALALWLLYRMAPRARLSA